MKLAQALNLRKKQKTDFDRTVQLTQSISVQVAGDTKPEAEPNQLVASLLSQIDEQWKLVVSIDAANNATKLSNGMTLSEALAKRDCIARAKEKMTPLISVSRGGGYGREKEGIVVLDVAKVKKIVDDLARQWRILDDLIQEMNWQVEL